MDAYSTLFRVVAATILLCVNLLAVFSWSLTNDPPKITLPPKSRKVAEGEVATFTCLASGNPNPEINWIHARRKIVTTPNHHGSKETTSIPNGSVLRINDVKKKDEGVYECEASNDVGAPVRTSFNLSVYGRGTQKPPGFPSITVKPNLSSVDKYRSTVMHCGAIGNPEPEFSWLKDFIPIESSGLKFSVMPTGALQLLNSTETYEGKYECIAENIHGMSISPAANLFVKARRVPPHFSATPDDTEVVPGGSVRLTCIASGQPAPWIVWKRDDIEILETKNNSGAMGVLHLSDIRESANYTCHAISNLGTVSHVVEVKVKALPKPPTSVLITDVSPNSVHLTWNSGNTEPIQSYVIKFRSKYTEDPDKYTEIKDILRTDYQIYTLNAYTEYEFSVMAVNKIGRSPPSTPVDVTTGELVPGSPPTNVRARSVSLSTVVVQWDEPKIPNGVIKGYKVYYTLTPPDMPVSLWTLHQVENSQLTTLSNLMKDRTYTISVLAFTSVGDGPLSEPVQVVTTPGVPDQPANFVGEAISPSSIQLQWDRPTSSFGTIMGYKLRFTDSNTRSNYSIDIGPNVDKHLLVDLTPSTVYHMTLVAVSEKGEGPASTTIQLETHPYALVSPPLSVSGKTLNSTSIEVSWSPPAHGAHIDSYNIYYSVTRNFEDDFTQRRLNLTSSATSVVLNDLEKFTAYKISVAAMNLAGEGPLSDVIIIKTEEDVPGEPKKVKVEVLNSTSVKVDWKPPLDREHHGDIKGYFVHFVEVDENGDERSNPQRSEPLGNTQNELIVGGLTPSTWYNFQVCAYTRKGEGLRSKTKKVKTKSPVPSPPRGFTLTLHKEEIPGSPRVVVTWQTPKLPHGRIEGYLVAFGISGESQVEERRFGEDVYRFATSVLERGATYEFKIAARNANGYGEYATEVIKTPEGIPSGAPENFTVTPLSPHSMSLRWDPPVKKHRHGDIRTYEVVYCESEAPSKDKMINTTETSFLVEKLDSDRGYTFLLRAFTTAGGGPWTNRITKKTLGTYMLPAPINVRLKHVTSTNIEVTWDEFYGRNQGNIQIVGYRVYYSSMPNTNVEKWPSIDVAPGTSAELQDLESSTTYAVKVRARGSDGRFGNFSETAISNRLDHERPDTVTGFFARTHNSRSVHLEWKPPRKPGVSRYKLEYIGVRKSRDYTGMEDTAVDPRKEVPIQKEERTRMVDGLMSRTLYTFNMTAKFIDGNWGAPSILQVETSSEASYLDAPFFIRPLTDHMVSVRLKPILESPGRVVQYQLVVVPIDLADHKNPDEFTYEELSEGSPRKGWIAAKYDGPSLPHEVIIGDGRRSNSGDLVNKPLPRGQNYVAFLKAVYSNNKHLTSPYSKPLLPDPAYPLVMPQHRHSIDLLWIVAPICAAVVLILLLVLIIIIARKRRVAEKNVNIHPNKILMAAGSADVSSTLVDPVDIRRMQFQSPAMMSHPPIPVNELATHIDSLRANDNARFSLEYESIDPGQQFTWEASNMEANKSKNRYANVIAYDHSRVVIQPLPQSTSAFPGQGQTIPGSDYINANFLDGFRKPNAYIATQGPMPETFADFWRMIWEKQSSTVVMMTKLEERGRVKCDQYWPSRGCETYGSLQVTLIDVVELATYTIRTFQITSELSSDKREVRQFQFTAWPDYGVPDHPTPLLLFMRRVKFMTSPDSGPIVVHCSAGVGRTGVFVILDSTLERIKHSGTVDIYGHVTCLRSQRNYMVQTEDQYVFIHTAILEAVTSGNTEVPARNLFVHMQRLLEPVSVTSQAGITSTMTGMEAEFKKLSCGRNSLTLFASANLSCNKQKNRLVNVLPFESSRVCLQPIRGVDGSDYINASFIDGYRYRKAYIATQGPLPDTVEDFWRAMWECNCNIIVMLTKLRELGREMCHQYWPSERSARYQYFVVDPLAEYNMPQYILREFKVTDARDGQSRTVRQFQLTDWPEQGVPSTGDGFIEFIGQVHKTKEQFGQEGPIAVHCSAGVGRTGVFITLSIVLERMRFEGVVDMFQTVNILRTQRPSMVQTEELYAFCYRAALEYLGSFDHYTN